MKLLINTSAVSFNEDIWLSGPLGCTHQAMQPGK